MGTEQPSTSFDFKYNPYLQNVEETTVEEDKEEEIKIFKCYLCSMEERYDYKGTNPPFAKHILMNEDCYMLEDPFLPSGQNEFITLGSDCSVCNKSVCKGVECSFFYLKTYCIKCLSNKIDNFPEDVQLKIKRLLKS